MTTYEDLLGTLHRETETGRKTIHEGDLGHTIVNDAPKQIISPIASRMVWRLAPALLEDLRNDTSLEVNVLASFRANLTASVSAVSDRGTLNPALATAHKSVSDMLNMREPKGRFQFCLFAAAKSAESAIKYEEYFERQTTAEAFEKEALAALSPEAGDDPANAALGASYEADSAAFYAAFHAAEATKGISDVLDNTQSLQEAVLRNLASEIDLDQDYPPRKLFETALWKGGNPVPHWNEEPSLFAAYAKAHPEWQFWLRTYEAFLNGGPFNWDLLRDVVLINDAIWQEGPKAVADAISTIEEGYPTKPTLQASLEPLRQNRAQIALIGTALKEQIADHRELVRQKNSLDNDIRESFFDFLDGLSADIDRLLELCELATTEERKTEAAMTAMGKWLKTFRSRLFVSSATYLDPENVVEAVVPTAIILGCTGLGALAGNSVAGGIVGGLITNQLKPAKAVDELIKWDPET